MAGQSGAMLHWIGTNGGTPRNPFAMCEASDAMLLQGWGKGWDLIDGLLIRFFQNACDACDAARFFRENSTCGCQQPVRLGPPSVRPVLGLTCANSLSCINVDNMFQQPHVSTMILSHMLHLPILHLALLINRDEVGFGVCRGSGGPFLTTIKKRWILQAPCIYSHRYFTSRLMSTLRKMEKVWIV